MKKLMTILLGLSLVIGTASVAFSQGEKGKGDEKSTKKQKGKKKGTAKKTVEK